MGWQVGAGLHRWLGAGEDDWPDALCHAARLCLVVVPCVLVIAVLIALIGTWFPARRIARLYPVEVLYGR